MACYRHKTDCLHCDEIEDSYVRTSLERDAAVARAEAAERRLMDIQGGTHTVHDEVYHQHIEAWQERAYAAERARDEAHADAMEKLDLAIAARDAAERARNEVGIQFAAAQERLRLAIACVKAGDEVVAAAVLACESQGMLDVLRHNLNALERRCNDYIDTKDALDTVPCDALAPKITAALEASGIDTGNVKGVG